VDCIFLSQPRVCESNPISKELTEKGWQKYDNVRCKNKKDDEIFTFSIAIAREKKNIRSFE